MLEHPTMPESEMKCFLYIKFQKLVGWGVGGILIIFKNKQNHQSLEKFFSWLCLRLLMGFGVSHDIH